MCIKLSASVCLLKLEALILDSGFETRVEKPMETSSLPGILIEYYLIYFLLFFFFCVDVSFILFLEQLWFYQHKVAKHCPTRQWKWHNHLSISGEVQVPTSRVALGNWSSIKLQGEVDYIFVWITEVCRSLINDTQHTISTGEVEVLLLLH